MTPTEMGLLLAGLATAAVVAALGASGARPPGECGDCGAGLSGDERVAGLCDDCSWGSEQW